MFSHTEIAVQTLLHNVFAILAFMQETRMILRGPNHQMVEASANDMTGKVKIPFGIALQLTEPGNWIDFISLITLLVLQAIRASNSWVHVHCTLYKNLSHFYQNLSKLFYSQISNHDDPSNSYHRASFSLSRNDKIVKPPFDLGAGKWIETTRLTGWYN